VTPSPPVLGAPRPPRLVKAPVAVHPLPQGGEGSKFKLRLPHFVGKLSRQQKHPLVMHNLDVVPLGLG
jgi:hypothetical protein